MNKPDWTIDSAARKVVHRSGFIALMERDGERWVARMENQGDDRSIIECQHGEEYLASAQGLWDREITTATTLLRQTGQALHGAEWMMPLGADLGVNRRTINRWMTGEVPLTRSHPVWKDVIRVMADRMAMIDDVQSQVIDMMADVAGGQGGNRDRRMARAQDPVQPAPGQSVRPQES